MQKSLFRPASTNSSNSSELHAGSTGPVASPRDGHRRLLRTLSVAAPEKGERRSPALKFALEPVNK